MTTRRDPLLALGFVVVATVLSVVAVPVLGWSVADVDGLLAAAYVIAVL